MKYAFNDFGIRQVAQLLGKTADEAYYTNRVRLPKIQLEHWLNFSLSSHW